MGFHDAPGDRQVQAGSPGRTRAGTVTAEKRFEQAGKVFGGYSFAGVRDADKNLGGMGYPVEGYGDRVWRLYKPSCR